MRFFACGCGMGVSPPRRRAGVAPAGAGWGVSCPGTSNLAVHNFRQPNQRFGASVVFFCKKKVTKENHSNLRFKDPLARGGQVQIWRCVLAGGVQRSSLSVKRTVPAFTGAEASATACPSHGRGICFYRVGDYQIAPLPPQGGKGRCARRAQDIIIS